MSTPAAQSPPITRAEAIAAAGRVLADAHARMEDDLATGGPAAVAAAAYVPGGPSLAELTRLAEERFGGGAPDLTARRMVTASGTRVVTIGSRP